MKNITNRTLSATVWNYQTPTATLRGGAGSFRQKNHSFREVGKRFFDVEAKREGLIEAVLYGSIAALSLWPMTVAARAILALMK